MTDRPTPREVIGKYTNSVDAADIIIAALDAAGYVIVPREATEAMIKAAIIRLSYDPSTQWIDMVKAGEVK